MASDKNLTVEDLQGPKRVRPLARVRREFIVEAFRKGHCSADIARMLSRTAVFVHKVLGHAGLN